MSVPRDIHVLRVRPGHSPNCSAAGSVVGAALLTAVGVAAVLNAFAGRLSAWRRDGDGGPPTGVDPSTETPPDPTPTDDTPRVRREAFGAIVAVNDPPALVSVDAESAQSLLDRGAREIGGGTSPAGALSAPTEAHIAVTDRCPVACDGCYLDAGPHRASPDPTATDLARDLDTLQAMGVFEVALGGGEVLVREDLAALIASIRARGMVPNLTTSGLGLTTGMAAALAPHVGQVNVSLDGVDETYAAVRGWDGTRVALRAIATLRDAGIRVGVNTVLSRKNVHALEAIGDAIAALGVSEWQWVRFKPAGRGVDTYAEHALSQADGLSLWPRLLDIEARTGLIMRVDCALVPFLAAHGPTADALARLGVNGCVGGESLWARGANGHWAPCSFAHASSVEDDRPLTERWQSDDVLDAWRARAAAPPAPCDTCDHQRVCRGGCRIVAGHVTGDTLAPDPECPRVIAMAAL